MASELNTEGKENITNEFMSGFGIESTNTLDSSDLNKYLDSEETVSGDPEKITPTGTSTDDETPPGPPSKKGSNQSDDGVKNKSKEEVALEKQTNAEKEKLEREKNLSSYINGDDPSEGGKGVSSKGEMGNNNPSDEQPDEAIAENLAVMSKEFYRLGFFTRDEEDEDESIKDPNAFLEKVNTSFKKGTQAYLENYLSHYSPKNRELFFATYEKGVDPEAYLLQLNKVESYEKMDLKQESNQELVITQSLRNQGWEEEDIKDQISKLKGFSELEDTAFKYHKGLVKSEKAKTKQLELEAEQENQRLAKIDEDYDNNLRAVYTERLKDKDFDGLPVTDKTVAKAYDFAYNKKWELNGALLTDFDRFILDLKKPENHAVKAKLALLFAQEYDPNKPIKVDFTKIQKKAVSKESRALFQDLATKSKATKNTPGYSNVVKSFFD